MKINDDILNEFLCESHPDFAGLEIGKPLPDTDNSIILDIAGTTMLYLIKDTLYEETVGRSTKTIKIELTKQAIKNLKKAF